MGGPDDRTIKGEVEAGIGRAAQAPMSEEHGNISLPWLFPGLAAGVRNRGDAHLVSQLLKASWQEPLFRFLHTGMSPYTLDLSSVKIHFQVGDPALHKRLGQVVRDLDEGSE